MALPSQILEGLRAFPSPTIDDALDELGLAERIGYAAMALRCQFPALPPMVGYAVTCTVDRMPPASRDLEGLHELFDALAAAPKPAVVVLRYVGADVERSCVAGDVICAAYRRLGAVGLVTDGGVRDLGGIRRRLPEFQVFGPGPVVSDGNWVRVLEVGIPVAVCGLSVRPGDLLHGDENGLLSMPVDVAEPALEQAGRVRDAEAETFDFLTGDLFTLDELKRRFTS
jgi:4-hydroxy-4-methyl-2-oxoglutarate aldolase